MLNTPKLDEPLISSQYLSSASLDDHHALSSMQALEQEQKDIDLEAHTREASEEPPTPNSASQTVTTLLIAGASCSLASTFAFLLSNLDEAESDTIEDPATHTVLFALAFWFYLAYFLSEVLSIPFAEALQEYNTSDEQVEKDLLKTQREAAKVNDPERFMRVTPYITAGLHVLVFPLTFLTALMPSYLIDRHTQLPFSRFIAAMFSFSNLVYLNVRHHQTLKHMSYAIMRRLDGRTQSLGRDIHNHFPDFFYFNLRMVSAHFYHLFLYQFFTYALGDFVFDENDDPNNLEQLRKTALIFSLFALWPLVTADLYKESLPKALQKNPLDTIERATINAAIYQDYPGLAADLLQTISFGAWLSATFYADYGTNGLAVGVIVGSLASILPAVCYFKHHHSMLALSEREYSQSTLHRITHPGAIFTIPDVFDVVQTIYHRDQHQIAVDILLLMAQSAKALIFLTLFMELPQRENQHYTSAEYDLVRFATTAFIVLAHLLPEARHQRKALHDNLDYYLTKFILGTPKPEDNQQHFFKRSWTILKSPKSAYPLPRLLQHINTHKLGLFGQHDKGESKYSRFISNLTLNPAMAKLLPPAPSKNSPPPPTFPKALSASH